MKAYKKIMSLVIVLTLILGTVNMAPNTTYAASSSKTLSEAMAWCESKLNTTVGSGECVAFVQEYLQYLGIPKVGGDAYKWATASIDTNYLTRIQGATPQAGDILIWTGGKDGLGHVAVCASGTESYHQRWNGYYVQKVSRSSNANINMNDGSVKYYWGVIRPNFNAGSHTHDFQFKWFLKSHPHHNEFQCSCGTGYVDTEINYYTECATCCAPKISDGWYKLASSIDTNFVATVQGDSHSLSANVELCEYDKNKDNQKVYFRYIGDGLYTIKFMHSGKLLDVASGGFVSGSNVQQYDSNGTDAQSWVLIDAGGGSFYLRPRHADLFLDVENGNMSNGTNIRIYNKIYTSGEMWKIIRLDEDLEFDFNGGKQVVNKVSVSANGLNVARAKDNIIIYNKSGLTTGTNVYGTEIIVEYNNQVIDKIDYGIGNSNIPLNGGYVISGHGTGFKWLEDNVNVGDYVSYNPDTLEISVYKDYNSYLIENSVVMDGEVGELPTATRDGYIFKGWYTLPKGGEKIINGTANVSTNKLYAQWEKKDASSKENVTTKAETTFREDITTAKNINDLEKVDKKIAKTKIKKIKKLKKALKISWKKVKSVNGYQLQYSTSKKFKKAKKMTIKKAKITTKTIKKLKAKKKYYVRIRTYIMVSGKKYYSNWSKLKSMKTK